MTTTCPACTKPRVWGLIGEWLDGDCLQFDASRTALMAARLISAQSGRGPDSTLIVIQRLRALVNEGKLEREDVITVLEMFDAAEDAAVGAGHHWQ